MRNNMAGAGRYKLIRRLRAAEGYEAYSALDIEVSTRPQVLLNIYSGAEAIRRMVPLFYGMDAGVCPDFVRVYTEDARFTAVFRLHEGEAFGAVFPPRGASLEGGERRALAESLLHAALECAAMPPALLVPLLREENLAVRKKERRIALNCILPPAAGGATGEGDAPGEGDLPREGDAPGEGDAPLALSPLLERVLRRPWRAPDEQIDFLDRAAQGAYPSVGALYSAWRALVPLLEADEARTRLLERVFRFLKRSFRRWRKRRRAERERKKRLREEAL